MTKAEAEKGSGTQRKLKKRTYKIAAFLLCAVIVSNPGLIPFLPIGFKVAILKALNKLFGDVSQITQIVIINWITVFQLIIMILAIMVVQDVTDVVLTNLKPKDRHAKTLIGLYMNISRYLYAIVAVLWGLNIIGISPGMIFAGVSIVAMVISFSAENLIADVVTGVLLLFDNVYNVDDIIEIDGYRGKVVSIGMRTTSIRDEGGNVQIINNSDMRNIINRSNDISKAICDVEISNTYTIDQIDKAVMEALKCIRDNHGLINKAAYKGIQKLEKESLTVRIEAEVKEENLFEAQRYMNREFFVALQNNGIKNVQ